MGGRRQAHSLIRSAALLFALACGGAAPSENVLLITVDTLRADHLGSYGYEHDTSPAIDRLASEGVLFRNAIVQRGGTWPSLTSILTSMYPHRHGVRANGERLDPSIWTLAEWLSQAGFDTVAILTNMTTAPLRSFGTKHTFRKGKSAERDAGAIEAALRFLEEREGGRFFLWLHLMGPHDPYAPAPYFQREVGYRGSIDGSHGVLMQIHREQRELSPLELARILSLYDGAIAEADARIDLVLAKLDELSLRENTLVVLTSDHGEELYDHNRYFLHSWSIYDSVLRVPLILRLPGRLPAGRAVGTVVESIDVAPTILELVGVERPEAFEGKSLLGTLQRDGDGVAFAELGPHVHSVRTGRWHYISNPRGYTSPGTRAADDGGLGVFAIEREELYDLERDPRQQENVAARHPEVVADLRARLATWREGARDHRVEALTEETEAELRALGYLD